MFSKRFFAATTLGISIGAFAAVTASAEPGKRMADDRGATTAPRGGDENPDVWKEPDPKKRAIWERQGQPSTGTALDPKNKGVFDPCVPYKHLPGCSR